MIRYYESIHLLQQSKRTEGGYRLYSERDVAILHFIKRARSLGFSLQSLGKLLSLWQDGDRASADAKAVAEQHIADLNQQINVLVGMRDTLHDLVQACPGNHRAADCPILQNLGETKIAHPQ